MGGWIGLDVVLLYILHVQNTAQKCFLATSKTLTVKSPRRKKLVYSVVCVPGIALGIQRLFKKLPST